jgi:disulfide bond formation protein DsbB
MAKMFRSLLRHWPMWALLASATALAGAHASQTFGGLEPCSLCLRQREVYWTAMAVAALALVAERTAARARLRPVFGLVLLAVFATGAVIAARHAGAEWKWWPGPQTCSSSGAGVSAASLARLLHGAKVAAPRCDEASWRLFGLSMAGWNFLISLGLAGLSGLSSFGPWTKGAAR